MRGAAGGAGWGGAQGSGSCRCGGRDPRPEGPGRGLGSRGGTMAGSGPRGANDSVWGVAMGKRAQVREAGPAAGGGRGRGPWLCAWGSGGLRAQGRELEPVCGVAAGKGLRCGGLEQQWDGAVRGAWGKAQVQWAGLRILCWSGSGAAGEEPREGEWAPLGRRESCLFWRPGLWLL